MIRLVTIAARQAPCKANRATTASAAAAAAGTQIDPGRGARPSDCWMIAPRDGNGRAFATSTTRISTRGTNSGRPEVGSQVCWAWRCVISDWIMPIASPAITAGTTYWKRPRMAAASAGMMNNV